MFDDYSPNGANLNSLHMIFSKKFHVIRRSWICVNQGPLSRRVNPSPCFKAVKTTTDLNFASLWCFHRVNQSCAKYALEFDIVMCKIPWIYQTLYQNPNTNVLKTIMTYNNKFKSTIHVLQFTNYSFYMIICSMDTVPMVQI